MDPEIKPFEWLIFPTKYVIPESLKPVGHWPSKNLKPAPVGIFPKWMMKGLPRLILFLDQQKSDPQNSPHAEDFSRHCEVKGLFLNGSLAVSFWWDTGNRFHHMIQFVTF